MHVCPRCQAANRDTARFCAECGMALEAGVDGTHRAGRVRHPRPAAVPAGMVPVEQAAQLYAAWESALGGPALIGTEGLRVTVFNAGYALEDVTLRVTGCGRDSQTAFSQDCEIADLPHGGQVQIEIPSYDLAEPVRTLRVVLVAAGFGQPESDAADRPAP